MAFDAFLKIEGIDGESQDKSHPGEIEIESFSWGVSNTSSGGGGGGGSGKAVLQGRHLQRATLTCRKAGFEFLKIKLDDVIISSYQTGGDAETDDRPEDQFSLNFVKIDFLYSVQRTGKTVETSFDSRV